MPEEEEDQEEAEKMQPAQDAKLALPNKDLDSRQPFNLHEQQILDKVAQCVQPFKN